MTKERIQEILGKNINAERTSRGMTIAELAEALKITEGFVGSVERGQRGVTLTRLYDIAQAFGVPIGQLFEMPGSGITLQEKSPDKRLVKRNKIFSMTYNLNEVELDYIISTILDFKRFIKDKDGIDLLLEDELEDTLKDGAYSNLT